MKNNIGHIAKLPVNESYFALYDLPSEPMHY